MKEIELTQGFVTKVDDDNYEHLSQWKWCVTKSRNSYYAVRGERRNGRHITIFMQNEILKVAAGNFRTQQSRSLSTT
jgi:hypothetical protein